MMLMTLKKMSNQLVLMRNNIEAVCTFLFKSIFKQNMHTIKMEFSSENAHSMF